MTWQTTEGIVLQSIPFQSQHRILKVFTQKKGLLSFFVKNISPNNSQLIALTTPFSYGEWVFQKSTQDLHKIKDTTLLNSFLLLRNSLDSLNAGGSILRAVLKTQMPNKPAPALFALLLTYLQKIPDFPNPDVLATSFYLKLLLLEGLLHFTHECSHCKKPACSLAHGESVCKNHTLDPSRIFSEKDWEVLHELTYARQFSKLKSLDVSPRLFAEIEKIFQELVN